MALFNKLFQTRKVTKSERSTLEDVKPFTFNKGQVRVLLFRECEQTGRKLLYDSSTVEKVSLHKTRHSSKYFLNRKNEESDEIGEKNSSNANILEMADGFGFKCKVVNPDAILLGEMIFGSVAMNYKGMSLKVHILNAPQRLMCTKVYCTPGRRKCPPNPAFSFSPDSISSSATTNASDILHKSGSNLIQAANVGSSSYSTSEKTASTANVSSLHIEDRLSVNWSMSKDDSGFCSEFSSHSSIGCNCNSDSSTCFWNKDNSDTEELFKFSNPGDMNHTRVPTSLQWRLNHHISTSLESPCVSPSSDLSSSTNKKQTSSSNISHGTSECLTATSGKPHHYKKEKMGLAIVITLTENIESQMLRFLLEHAVLVEGALSRLRVAVRDALSKPHVFISNMAIATHEAAQWLVDLLTCPRIGAPLWPFLSCLHKRSVGDKIADIFLKDLCSLLSTMDTKDTYFFMSTLITNVLTHHLGWVNSVSPYNVSRLSQQKDLELLNNVYPYNPLWAQLGELYGVIGMPTKISKTVIYGKQNISVVKKILNVLSYFIRCVEVKRLTIETHPVPWNSIDILMKSYNTDVIKLEDCMVVKCHTRDNPTEDFIEMKTFTTNENDNLKEIPSKCNLHVPAVTTNTLKVCSNNSRTKTNTSLKRVTSHANRLESFSKINSIKTFESNFPSPNKQTDNDRLNNNSCDISDSKTKRFNSSDNQSDVNNLCRVSTKSVLTNLQEFNDELVSMDNSFNVNSNVSSEKRTKCFDTEQLEPFPEDSSKQNVVFVLGEDEVLVGIKKIVKKEIDIVTSEKEYLEPVVMNKDVAERRSKSYPRENPSCLSPVIPERNSLQRDTCCTRNPQCKHSKFKKHSGVKFEFDKYPQIVTNYMKSKNLELLDRHVIGKPGNLKIDGYEFEAGSSIMSVTEDSDTCVNCSLNGQTLQTPSNASELEYTSDIPDQREIQFTKDKIIIPKIVTHTEHNIEQKVFIKQKLEHTLIVNSTSSNIAVNKPNSPSQTPSNVQPIVREQEVSIELPLPTMAVADVSDECSTAGYCHSLLGGIADHYVSDLVLQGGVGGKRDDWERLVRRDLALQRGATCLLADIDEWSVRVWGGGAGGMSALVASMLDSLPQMCNAKVPPTQCLAYIESKLRELCIRSKALAQLLLDKDFCDMEYLTKTLNLDPNDVPLLLAIASTHTPQVTLKYGVSYR